MSNLAQGLVIPSLQVHTQVLNVNNDGSGNIQPSTIACDFPPLAITNFYLVNSDGTVYNATPKGEQTAVLEGFSANATTWAAQYGNGPTIYTDGVSFYVADLSGNVGGTGQALVTYLH